MKRFLLGGVVLAAAMAFGAAPAMARGFEGHGRGDFHAGRGYVYHGGGFRGGFGFDVGPGLGYYGGSYGYPYYYGQPYYYGYPAYSYPGYRPDFGYQ